MHTDEREEILSPRWKVAKVDTKGKVMDVTDCDPQPVLTPVNEKDAQGRRIPQPRYSFNFTRYNADNPDAGSIAKATHWVTEEALLVLCDRILDRETGQADPKNPHSFLPMFEEYKGGHVADRGLVSRYFSVTYAEKTHRGEVLRTGPVYQFRFKHCAGQEGRNGQIMPVPGSQAFLDEQIAVQLWLPGGRDVIGLCLVLQNYVHGKTAAAHTAGALDALWRQLAELDRKLGERPGVRRGNETAASRG